MNDRLQLRKHNVVAWLTWFQEVLMIDRGADELFSKVVEAVVEKRFDLRFFLAVAHGLLLRFII